MAKDLVVVSVHGRDYIDRCLESLGDRYEVWPVDTGVSYQMGAVMAAYYAKGLDGILFIQDSMVALQPDYLEPFKAIMPKRGCVAWALFDETYGGGAEWKAKVRKAGPPQYDLEFYPDGGIFGPIFYTRQSVLDELWELALLPPTPSSKAEDQLTERFWLWAFREAGMEVRSLYPEWNKAKMERGEFPPFAKVWANRQ